MWLFSVLLLLVAVLFQSTYAGEQREKVVDFHAECLEKHGVSEQDLHDALDGEKMRTDDDFYLHFFCTAVKGKFMLEDGSVAVEDFETKMKDVVLPENMDHVAALVRKCLIKKSDIITTVREAVDCFLKEDHRI